MALGVEGRHHRVPVPGGHMAVHDVGDGAPVVLLHGIPGSGATWDGVVARLRTSFRVLVPDLLGFAMSSRPASGAMLLADRQADALAVALDALAVGRVAVVGHDFGGPVALLLSAARPDLVDRLGLLATNAFPDTPVPFPLSTVRWPGVGALARLLLFSRPAQRMMVRAGTGGSARRLDPAPYLGDIGQSRAVATIFAAGLRDLAERYAPVEDALCGIEVPLFVGWGDRDPFFPIEQGERTARAAGTRLRVYRGAGHFLPEERAAEVAADLARLCDRSRA
ncbi:MAG TPA: alpha/beta hydrolase [Acidimicrobiales bacterium]|nr:alpha/beta hydrolase [Acidimicrobiales bacterium]